MWQHNPEAEWYHSLLAQNPETSRVPQTHLSTIVYRRVSLGLVGLGKQFWRKCMSIPADDSERPGFLLLCFFLPSPGPTPEQNTKASEWKALQLIKIKTGIIFQVEVQNSLLFARTSFSLKSDGASEDFSVLSQKQGTHPLFHWRPPGWDPVFILGQVNTRTKWRAPSEEVPVKGPGLE